MSILKRLRDALQLRPHHDEALGEPQFPIPSRRFRRLFGSTSRSNQRKSPPIIPPLDVQSTFWPSLLDVTSSTLAPAKTTAQGDEMTDFPTTGAVSSIRRFVRVFRSKSRSKPRELPHIIRPVTPQSTFWSSFSDVTSAILTSAQSTGRFPHTHDDDVANVSTTGAKVSSQFPRLRRIPVQPLRAQSTFHAPLLDLSSDSLPASGFLGDNFYAEDTNASYDSLTGTMASFAISPLNILRHGLSTDSLDDVASTEFMDYPPSNEDGDAEDVSIPQTAPILKLPNELLCQIMTFLLSTEPLCEPSHLLLLAPRHVCKSLRNAAEQEISMTLNASHVLFDKRKRFSHRRSSWRGNLELRRWFKRRSAFQHYRQAVSLQVDMRGPCELDRGLLNDFVGALPNCRQARVEFHGPGGALETLTTFAVPPSQIQSFSWISATLGIHEPIPLDNFPWRVLVNDLPWSQLTHLSLDCPLSDLDAYEVLSNGCATFKSVTLKLTNEITEANGNPILKKYLSGDPVALPTLRSLTIDTNVPVKRFLSKLLLSALEHLDMKSHVYDGQEDEGSPLLNQHLNVPWTQLRSLSLSNEDNGARRRCPVTAILMECSQLQRFQWDGPSDTLETFAAVLSFRMSKQLEELVIKSSPRRCELLLEKLLYDGNAIRRINTSYLMNLTDFSQMNASAPRWTHITVCRAITLSDLSEILINATNLIKAVFHIIEGGIPLTSTIHSPLLQQLEILTDIRTPSLWERLYTPQIRTVQIAFGGVPVLFNPTQVLDDMAPFVQRYPNLPSPLIRPEQTSSPYDLLT